jgi:hypothetical protein
MCATQARPAVVGNWMTARASRSEIEKNHRGVGGQAGCVLVVREHGDLIAGDL